VTGTPCGGAWRGAAGGGVVGSTAIGGRNAADMIIVDDRFGAPGFGVGRGLGVARTGAD